MEDSRSVANSLGTQEMQRNHIATLQERIARYDAVTLDDVQAVANDIIDAKHLAMAAVGPVSDPAPYEKILSF